MAVPYKQETRFAILILDLDDLERAHSKIFQWPSLSLSNADPSQPNANPTPLVGLEPSFFDLNFYFRGGKQVKV